MTEAGRSRLPCNATGLWVSLRESQPQVGQRVLVWLRPSQSGFAAVVVEHDFGRGTEMGFRALGADYFYPVRDITHWSAIRPPSGRRREDSP